MKYSIHRSGQNIAEHDLNGIIAAYARDEIQPTDIARSSDGTEVLQIAELFRKYKIAPPARVAATADASHQTTPVPEKPKSPPSTGMSSRTIGSLVAGLLCCAPIGLLFIWTDTDTGPNQKRNYSLLASAPTVLFLAFLVIIRLLQDPFTDGQRSYAKKDYVAAAKELRSVKADSEKHAAAQDLLKKVEAEAAPHYARAYKEAIKGSDAASYKKAVSAAEALISIYGEKEEYKRWKSFASTRLQQMEARKQRESEGASERRNATEAAEDAKKRLRETCTDSPAKALELSNHSWSKNEYISSLVTHSVLVRNPCPLGIRDVQFHVTFVAPSGTVIDTVTKTVYQIVPANGSRWMKFDGIAHEQATSARIEVTAAQGVE